MVLGETPQRLNTYSLFVVFVVVIIIIIVIIIVIFITVCSATWAVCFELI